MSLIVPTPWSFSGLQCARGMFYYERETNVAIIFQRFNFSLFRLSLQATYYLKRNLSSSIETLRASKILSCFNLK